MLLNPNRPRARTPTSFDATLSFLSLPEGEMLPLTDVFLPRVPFRARAEGRSPKPDTSMLKGAIVTPLRRTTRSSRAEMWNGSSEGALVLPPFVPELSLPRRARREPSTDRPLTAMSTPALLRTRLKEKSLEEPERTDGALSDVIVPSASKVAKSDA